MRVDPNTSNLTGIVCCLFWYGVYALALCLLFASRICLLVKDSKAVTGTSQLKYGASKNPLNYKTT